MSTFAELIVKIERELSLMNGISVQTYGEPKLAAKLQRAFNIVYDKRFWKDHRKFTTFTTDGATGMPVGLPSGAIKRYADIEYVWHDCNDIPLPEAPTRVNPLRIMQLCIAPSNTEAHFCVWPKTFAGTFGISYRTRPNEFTDTDVVPFDDDYLIATVCADYLIDEGANKEAAQKFAKIADDRLQILLDLETSQDKAMASYTSSYPTEWQG